MQMHAVLLSGLVLMGCCWAQQPTTALTNIVLLLADDLGFGEVEYNSRNLSFGARTPNLNALSQGQHTLQFNNFHSASSVCSPTRAAILTSRHPDRDCVVGANALYNLPGRTYKDEFPFHTGMPSIAFDAKAAGYVTGLFGKWHLGPMADRSPGAMGFEHWVASTGNVPTFTIRIVLHQRRTVRRVV